MITTVIFDLDDTLYNEIDYCKSGFKAVADFLTQSTNASDTQGIYQSMWKQFNSGNRTRTFNTALSQLGITCNDTLIAEMVKTYRNHTPEITLPAESANVISQLTGKYTLALLTDGFMPAQQLKVQALGIEKHFKIIIYTELLGRKFWKPSPVGFAKIMNDLNEKPQNLCYVADNETKDFIAPNQLGFISIQLKNSTAVHPQGSTNPYAKAAHTINKIAQLPPLLQKL